jgi:hypothetical protein
MAVTTWRLVLSLFSFLLATYIVGLFVLYFLVSLVARELFPGMRFATTGACCGIYFTIFQLSG